MKKDEIMISAEDAAAVMEGYGVPEGMEEVPLMDARGRVAAEDIRSGIAMPPFDKSAMDGFAVSSKDPSHRFRIVETIPAGKFPRKRIVPGECARIMTGAPLPEGADRVIRVEVTREKDGFMELTGRDPSVNVCLRGEDIRPGDVIIRKGRRMDAPGIGAAASLGVSAVKVYPRVKAGLVTTGSEIVEPGTPLAPGQIYNSNGFSLAAQLMESGAAVPDRRIVPDDPAALKEALGRVIETSSLTLISGGVSMGEFDLVPGILEEIGVRVHFNKVAVQPGKPTLFGTRGDKVIFGLPGNPVSTFVIFEIFVKPVLMRMAGARFEPVILRGTLGSGFRRKKTERDLYVPVRYREGMVELIEYHGSAHFAALLEAEGLLKIPKGTAEIGSGERVDVRQI